MFALLPLGLSAQTLSNGTGGGDWSVGSTWATNTVPTGLWEIQSGDTVDVVAGTSVTATTGNVYGTLNIASGATATYARFGNSTTAGGIINSAGNLRATRLIGSVAYTVNITDGTFTLVDGVQMGTTNSGSPLTFNVSGGVSYLGAPSFTSGTQITLSGGTIIFTNGLNGLGTTVMPNTAWNGGTIVVNKASGLVSLMNNQLNNADGNRLQLSNQSAKVSYALTAAATATDGGLVFNVFSSTANDNDQITSTYSLNLGSSVQIDLLGQSLTGVAGDYLGATYKLFDLTDYSKLDATISSTVWNIGGEDYDVAFTNNLKTDGSVTVASLTLATVPEPSTVALFAGIAVVAGAVCRRNRHASRA